MTTHTVPATVRALQELANLAYRQGWTADEGLKLALTYLEHRGHLVDFLRYCRGTLPPVAPLPPPPVRPLGGKLNAVQALRERAEAVRPSNREASKQLRQLAYAIRWRGPHVVYRHYQTLGVLQDRLPAKTRAYLEQLFQPFQQKAVSS